MGQSIRYGRAAHSHSAGYGSHNSTISDYDEENKPKVFISHSRADAAQVGLLRYQAENENYNMEFEDTSLKDPVKYGDWKGSVGTKICHSDAVIVLVGEDTASRTAVSWEVQYAYSHDIPVIPIRIHSDKKHKLPKPITQEGDHAVKWEMKSIQKEINDKAER